MNYMYQSIAHNLVTDPAQMAGSPAASTWLQKIRAWWRAS